MKKLRKLVDTIFKSERIIGLVLFGVASFLLCTLYTYSTSTHSIFYVDSSVETSTLLWILSSLAAILFFLCGAAVIFIPLILFYSSYFLIMNRSLRTEWDRLAALVVLTFSSIWLLAHSSGLVWRQMVLKGGLVGDWLVGLLSFDSTVSYMVGVAFFLSSFIIFTRLSFVLPFYYGVRACKRAGVHHWIYRCYKPIKTGLVFTFGGVKWVYYLVAGHAVEKDSAIQFDKEQAEQLPVLERIAKDVFWRDYTDINEGSGLQFELQENDIVRETTKVPAYRLPRLDLFTVIVDEKNQDALKAELEKRAQILEDKLARFGIEGKVVHIKRGPVVTCFEYHPKDDTKLSRITALEDDLALALEAMSLRILAPIPGTSVVGFEVANKKRQQVLLADSIHSDEYKNFTGTLPLILGKDTIGKDLVVDLFDMPHLLIAGSTGSGKSVALNVMLMSLLCRKNPDELKLILIDPKRLEFSAYADIPHLLFPIVTLPKRAIQALKWVVKTMEERYDVMSKEGVRSIVDYHKQGGSKAKKAMPYIVVVIDELADLMMTSGKCVEEWIARIAQMARAAGIHMIVATQRPSVDVITGLIKVNFPSRISFRVTSRVDSRTILDESGAEKLLGCGDMLFLDAKQSVIKRAHCAYVSDEEIKRVVNHMRGQFVADYLDFDEQGVSAVNVRDEDDELYNEIVSFLHDVDEVSISLLQRRFRIGYNRSARLIDMLELQGLIMSHDGGRARKVVKQG